MDYANSYYLVKSLAVDAYCIPVRFEHYNHYLTITITITITTTTKYLSTNKYYLLPST